MTPGLLLAFVSFAFVSSITPGPNNAMLLASGVNYGFRRTLPHIVGISAGCAAMLVLVGLGLGAIFIAVPQLFVALRWIGAAYLLWLAWTIARAGRLTNGKPSASPLTFWKAAAFQWANPKAWIIVVGAATAYLPHKNVMQNVMMLTLLLGLIMTPCMCVWTSFGVVLRRLLSDTRRVRIFNGAMAALLVLSLLPLLAR